jgi:organic radical activating enzyme
MKIIEVCLMNYCNFKCTYCISDPTRGCDKFFKPLRTNKDGYINLHPSGTTKDNYEITHDKGDFLDFESLITFVRTKLDSDWLINLTGGEPLYYPKVEELILELTKTNKVLLTTNLSLIKTKPELLSLQDRLFFRVGYHPEFRNVNTFIELVKYLEENNFKYIINYVLHPKYYIDSELFLEHLEPLDNNNFVYEVTPFEGEYNSKQYPTPYYMRDSIEKMLLKDPTINYEEVKMGLDFLICEPTGKIYECQGRKKQVGSVYDLELNLERVDHQLCFFMKFCSTLESTKTYLEIFNK